jgi:hypothetical protein
MRNVVKGAVLACVGGILACLFAFLQAGPAGASTYPPTTCATLAVSTTTPRPGQTITVTGEQFKPNESVGIHMTPYGIKLAQVTTDSSGSFSAQVTMPLDARGNQLIKTDAPGKVCPADPIQIVVSGSGTGGGGSSAPGSGSGQPPAMTGVDIALLSGVAVALIAVGVLFARSGRGSRHASSLRH